MEILDLRHFSSSDLRPVLGQETAAWSHMLAWDYRSSSEMILRYVDAKILPGYAAVDRGELFGYCFFVYEGSKGVIGDLYADAGQRIRAALGDFGVEHRLLRHVIETLQQSPGIRRIEAQLLIHDTGAVAPPFLAAGFQQHRRLFMVEPLAGTPAAPEIPLSGIDLRRWSDHDYQDAASIITQAYRGHIDSDINDQYRTVSGSTRFLNNIVRFPGCGTFDASASFVAVHRATRRPVGVILCSRVRDDVGHVTQVCVVPEVRGLHVGHALLHAAANDLRRRRFSALSLTVTEANANAVALYRRIGYETRHVFDAFVWDE